MFARLLMLIGFFVFSLPLFSLYSGIVGCAGPVDDSSESFPETCAELQETVVDETGERPENGTYTLYVNGDESQPWTAYCHDMQRAEPIEFLTVTESDNYSQIRDDNFVATTTYRRYRIDPIRLEINPLDDTFASSDFDSFEPVLPDDLEFIPAGWAEVQPMSANDGTPAESNASLEGTAFVFDESIDGDNFFCQVDSEDINETFTDGTGVTVSNDLQSFHLTAVNTFISAFGDVSTREVADCTNLGTDVTEFESGAWPLQYVGE